MSYTSSQNSTLKHLTGITTPSMSSSTSSGYGSQAVSCSNLTNDDTVSMRSMSIDETPDFDRVNSCSPPNKTFNSTMSNSNNIENIPTPSVGGRQARFNPFLKDMPTLSTNNKSAMQTEGQTVIAAAVSTVQPSNQPTKCLTPTKDHPLKDIDEGETQSQDSQYSDDNKNEAQMHEPATVVADTAAVMDEEEDEDEDDTLIAGGDENKNELSELQKAEDNQNANNKSLNVQTTDECNVDEDEDIHLLDNHQKSNFVQSEGTGVVKTQLPPGKVVRRKKTVVNQVRSNSGHRASLPMMKSNDILTSSNDKLNAQFHNMSSSGTTDSSERLEDDGKHHVEVPLPEWVTLGESVQIRPYNTTGVISFVGQTHFQGGTWIGVELDTPTGKNDGSVQGIQYFQCKAKHGIFVRVDKLILDKRGKAMRQYKAEKNSKALDANISRSRSRGEALNTLGTSRK